MNETTLPPSIDKPWLKYYDEAAVVSATIPECSAYEYIFNCNKDALNDVAIEFYGARITYKELFAQIDRVAAAFASIGVGAGDTVSLALPNIPENTYCFYALNKIGAVASFVDPRYKAPDIEQSITKTYSKVLVGCMLFAKECADAVSRANAQPLVLVSPYESMPFPLRTILRVKSRAPKVKDADCMAWDDCLNQGENVKVEAGLNEVACILRTSGTTGMPKFLTLTNKNLNVMSVNYGLCGISFAAHDRFLNQVPTFLAYNIVMATHLPLSKHMRLLMLADYQPEKFAANISRLKPNHAIAGPADWSNFLTDPPKCKDFSFLRTLASGGDSMKPQVREDVESFLAERGCKNRIIEGYGMTEIGSAACTNVPQHNVSGTAGIPLPLNCFCIWDEGRQVELPCNETGEICMSGPTVMEGYLKAKDDTGRILRKHGDRLWRHSGDLGYMTPEGDICICGREKRIIVRHDGIKVSPFVIEQVINDCDGVVNCCAISAPDEAHGFGNIPVAYVVLDGAIAPDDKVLRIKAACEQRLPSKYQPSRIVSIGSLPLTQVGKVDYRKLEAMAAEEVSR